MNANELQVWQMTVDEVKALIETNRQQTEELIDAGGMISMLREEVSQQTDRIAELEKDLALKTRDRDVFRDFTLAYEKRIEELEYKNSLLVNRLEVITGVKNERL